MIRRNINSLSFPGDASGKIGWAFWKAFFQSSEIWNTVRSVGFVCLSIVNNTSFFVLLFGCLPLSCTGRCQICMAIDWLSKGWFHWVILLGGHLAKRLARHISTLAFKYILKKRQYYLPHNRWDPKKIPARLLGAWWTFKSVFDGFSW